MGEAEERMRGAARSGSRSLIFSLALAASAAAVFVGTASAAPGDLGVTMVKDINPAPGDGSVSSIVRFGDVVLFAADDGVNGSELWRSDGTAAGTTMVKDINPGNAEDPPDPDSSDPTQLTVVGGTVYFVANDGVTGPELWKTDGTAAGTTLVEDINLGTDDDPPSPDGSNIDQMAGVNGSLFFRADDGTNGPELWKSDGTELGTQIMNGPNGINTMAGAGSSPYGMTAVGTTLFFGADDGSTGTELWKSESPYTSAVQAANINTAMGASSSPVFFTNYNGTLLFRATDGSSGIELWKSNGGALGAGTELVEDINQTPTSSANSNPNDLTVAGGILYFQADDGSTGPELWKSDGTAAGTDRVADILTGSIGSTPQLLSDVGGTLFFRAPDSTAGLEPWKSNGGPLMAGGTERIADIRSGLMGSEPGTFSGGFTDVGGTAFFDANDGVAGTELWMSNGGPLGAGTRLVANINPGGAGSVPGQLTNVNGTLFFSASDGSNGNELWRTFIEGPAPIGGGGPLAGPAATTVNPLCAPLRKKLKKAKSKAKKKKIRSKLRKLDC
jgi:trimeric autotransporter adhesin